ncbi:MAG: sigma-70 family RNA polymerase sigma factor [Deltaproteobacteria bacterium]|nr:sigma-70 family RNA polymerase sigma factor [Deltaproteobacteria bacterium]
MSDKVTDGLMNSPNDGDLVNRSKGGDHSAFEELLRKYQDRIFNLCRYMLHDNEEAQDAAQDTFIKSYNSLKDFKPEVSFYTWLYRIAVNTCLDFRKKVRLVPSDDESAVDNLPYAQPSPEGLVQSKETGRLIETALQKISKKFRTVIILKEIEGLSYEEIAEVLHISIGTVKSRISRAREELRKLLQKK